MKVRLLSLAWSALFLVGSAEAQEFVQIADREVARRHYNATFVTVEPPMLWTGDFIIGNAVSTDGAFRNAVFAQINYFRSQAGLLAVIENPVYSTKAQQAALMVSVNNKASHYPTPDWTFYTADGAEAALRSNLYLGVSGIKSIEGYIDDQGPSNTSVGHRNWILRPETATMGTGDVPANAIYRKANALWVVTGENSPRTSRSPYNCWPPADGFTPYQVVYRRWSFKLPSGGLDKATVQMWNSEGKVVALTIESQPSDNRYPLVWVPQIEFSRYDSARRAPVSDEWYRVEISGITGISESTVRYTVVIFDPAKQALAKSPGRLDITASNETATLSWWAPDISTWTPYSSRNLNEWQAVATPFEYDGFRVQMHVPIGSCEFFALRK